MELTSQRDSEKHVARELAIKLSETAVELEETKDKVHDCHINVRVLAF